MNSGTPPVRIAHAYGNHRQALRRALDAPIDMIEADIWYRAGEIWVRHERRLKWLPLLADRRSTAAHSAGPLTLRLWKGYYIRPDIRPLKLADLLDTVAGRKRLLLDVKGSGDRESAAFGAVLARRISQHNAGEWAVVCGQFWPVLHRLRERSPRLEVRYSIEKPHQWRRFRHMLEAGDGARKVCMEHRFLVPERARFLEDNGIDVYCWTVDDPAAAERLVAQGVDGIISNDLSLLGSLGKRRSSGRRGVARADDPKRRGRS